MLLVVVEHGLGVALKVWRDWYCGFVYFLVVLLVGWLWVVFVCCFVVWAGYL